MANRLERDGGWKRRWERCAYSVAMIGIGVSGVARCALCGRCMYDASQQPRWKQMMVRNGSSAVAPVQCSRPTDSVAVAMQHLTAR